MTAPESRLPGPDGSPGFLLWRVTLALQRVMRAALAPHQLSARPYSPTSLQHFAACPYRFLLQAIHRLQPREEPEAIELIDPLTRGGLFHEVQFEILTALRAANLLPLTSETLPRAELMLDQRLNSVAKRWRRN